MAILNYNIVLPYPTLITMRMIITIIIIIITIIIIMMIIIVIIKINNFLACD